MILNVTYVRKLRGMLLTPHAYANALMHNQQLTNTPPMIPEQ